MDNRTQDALLDELAQAPDIDKVLLVDVKMQVAAKQQQQ